MKNSIKIKKGKLALQKGLTFISDTLKSIKVDKKDIDKAILYCEETLEALLDSDIDGDISITVVKKIFLSEIRIIAYGEDIKQKMLSSVYSDDMDTDSPDAVFAIRNLILSASKKNVNIVYKNKCNKINITVGEPAKKQLVITFIALFTGLLFGIILKMAIPIKISFSIDKYLFIPVKTIFLNAIQFIIAPLIFFSICASICTLKDISELGKLAIKTLLFYLFTSACAVCVGFLVFEFFGRIEVGSLLGLVASETASTNNSISFLDTIINIMPNNFFGSFVKNNTLQIIVIAVFVGIATTTLGKHSEKMSEFIAIGNELFCSIANIIIKFLPIMLFCSMASMVLSINYNTVTVTVSIITTAIIGFIIMFTIYLLLASIIAKVSTIKFFKNVFPAWLNAFALSSSSASIPFTMDICKNNLKISPKVYSFTIPLGATINMDGSTLFFVINTMFFIKGFNMSFNLADYFIFILFVLLLSMGCPGINGAGIACMEMLCAQFGIPMEALTIFIPIHVIFDPVITATNVVGDVVGTYVVAKTDGYVSQEI